VEPGGFRAKTTWEDAGKKGVSSICLQNCVSKSFFHRGTPKIILLYPKEPLPVNALTDQTTKRQLVVHGEYSSITNCWTNITMIFQGLFGIFCTILKYSCIPCFIMTPITVFCRTLFGKHCSKTSVNCYQTVWCYMPEDNIFRNIILCLFF